MYYILFLKCIVSGFFLAAPIGPINLICIRRTLTEGRVPGLVVGMGAAAADALYGYTAAAGLSIITSFVLHNHMFVRWVGGFFIMCLGVKIFCTAPSNPETEHSPNHNPYKLFAEVALLTLTNPATVFSFIAVFSSFGIAVLITNFWAATLAALGVFFGSALWWITLTSIVCLFRNKVTPNVIASINKIAGTLIILLGVGSIIKF